MQFISVVTHLISVENQLISVDMQIISVAVQFFLLISFDMNLVLLTFW